MRGTGVLTIRRRLASAFAVAFLAALCAAPVTLGADPSDVPVPDPTGAQLALLNDKFDAARDWMSVKTGSLTVAQFNAAHPESARVSLSAAGAQGAGEITPMAASGALGLTQVTQSTGYRCGSATAYEILKYLRVATGPSGQALDQYELGRKCIVGLLCTEVMTPVKNTPWFVGASYPDAGGFPMPSTLNKWSRTAWYAATKGTMANLDLSDYVSALVYDIDHAHPLALNIEEHANTGYHLAGHPSYVWSQHWVAAYGYASTGATTNYADSIHGVPTSTIGWAATVPQYSPYPSSRMYAPMHSYGYVW